MLKVITQTKKAPALTLLTLVSLLQGCMQQKNIHPEIPALDSNVTSAVVSELTAADEALPQPPRWWAALSSETLNQLVATAVENNHDLRATQFRLQAAAARLRQAEDQAFPQGGIYTDFTAEQRQMSPGASAVSNDQGRVGIDARWSLDLFGKIDASIRAVEAGIQAQSFARDQVMAEIVTAVVETYTRLAGTQSQIAVLDQQLKSIKHTLDTLETRVAEGYATPLELYRARVLRYEFEAKRPVINVQAAQYRSDLATLVGEAVPYLSLTERSLALPENESLKPVLANAQQSILNHPAVLAARARVVQAGALSDQAKAAMYPDISMRGLVGWFSAGSLQLGEGKAHLSVAPELRWSLLNLNALRANLTASQYEERAALAEYEKHLLVVLNRADQSIRIWNARNQRMSYLNQRHQYAQKAENQARVRYEEGAIPYVEFLDAQRDLLSAEEALIVAKIEWSASYTDLFRAFSGSWLPLLKAQPDRLEVSGTGVIAKG